MRLLSLLAAAEVDLLQPVVEVGEGELVVVFVLTRLDTDLLCHARVFR